MSGLYQQALIEHHKKPIGFERVFNASHQASGENLACGDEIQVSLEIDESNINNVAFNGDSCAICRASASIMCKTIHNKTVKDVKTLLFEVQGFLQEGSKQALSSIPDELSPLIAVRSYPVRLQCAQLPWSTLERAIS